MAEDSALASRLNVFNQIPALRTFALMVGVAAVVGVMVVLWLWGQQPEYRVLFSNFADRDGGAIVSALEQMNVPYRFNEAGNALLVPVTQVHDTRLKLAAQGLPKGSGVGFELMEQQKFGASQFVEQINFQRALEGELARSIQSLAAVESARVHLALPKDSVFVREQQKPTASVILNLRGSRGLDDAQVNAIVHLVASSVPSLPATNVTVVDQNGALLSEHSKTANGQRLDTTQLKYIQQVQEDIAKRIESILLPIAGAGNVRAEVSADIDFSRIEQAAEMYKPNTKPENAAIRSQQSSENQSKQGTQAEGVPGALTNQPPAPATAPLTTNPTPANAASSSATENNGQSARESVVNYEVDKTVSYTQQSVGTVKRLSVAVLVNDKSIVDKAGKQSNMPWTDTEKTQITALVREAMGFNQERGDSLNVVTKAFVQAKPDKVEATPIWQRTDLIAPLKDILKYLAMIVVLLLLYSKVFKPLFKRLLEPAPAVSATQAMGEEGNANSMVQGYTGQLSAAKQMAKQNPKAVAGVVKKWVNENE